MEIQVEIRTIGKRRQAPQQTGLFIRVIFAPQRDGGGLRNLVTFSVCNFAAGPTTSTHTEVKIA